MRILMKGCEHMPTPRVYVGSWERVFSTRYNPPIVDSFLSHPTEFNEVQFTGEHFFASYNFLYKVCGNN